MSIGSGHGGSTSSLVAVHGGTPELLVALCYQSLTGRLTVEILKASNLRMPAMQRAPGKHAYATVTIEIITYVSVIRDLKYALFEEPGYEIVYTVVLLYPLRSVSPIPTQFAILPISTLQTEYVLICSNMS